MIKNKMPIRFKTSSIKDFLSDDYRLYEVGHGDMMIMYPIGSSDDLDDLNDWAHDNLDGHVIVSGQLHKLTIEKRNNVDEYNNKKMLNKLVKLEKTLRKIGRRVRQYVQSQYAKS